MTNVLWFALTIPGCLFVALLYSSEAMGIESRPRLSRLARRR